MSFEALADAFKLKSVCVDCPFRRNGGVRHGVGRAIEYASYFVFGMGSTFPCHRSVPEQLSREDWTPWQPGQQMCAGGLILAEKVGHRSEMVKAVIAEGFHDPATLENRDQVFDTVAEMVMAHEKVSTQG